MKIKDKYLWAKICAYICIFAVCIFGIVKANSLSIKILFSILIVLYGVFFAILIFCANKTKILEDGIITNCPIKTEQNLKTSVFKSIKINFCDIQKVRETMSGNKRCIALYSHALEVVVVKFPSYQHEIILNILEEKINR